MPTESDTGSVSQPDAPNTNTPRPWLGIQFRCCNMYGRMYKTADGRRYTGRCPRCGTPVEAMVGQGGTDRRFFTTS